MIGMGQDMPMGGPDMPVGMDMIQARADEAMSTYEAEQAEQAMQANAQMALGELLAFCNSWIEKSRSWRQSSFEDKWNTYRRNADSIYDPTLKDRKESWQSKAYVPVTASHRETIKSQLYKTMAGPRPILEVKAIGTPQGEDQSDNIRDLIARETDKSRFDIEIDKVLDDATTYGSGHCRLRFEIRKEERRVRVPVYPQVDPNDMAAVQASMSGQLPPVDYQETIQEVETYRGTVIEHLSIWDVFPDPQALKIKGNSIAYRYRIKYGDIVKGAEAGYYFPSAVDDLRDFTDAKPESDKAQELADRGITDERAPTTPYSAELECYEFYARLPAKWVYWDGSDQGDPERLVPARVLFHANSILAVELNDSYDGEPNIYKMDYLPVPGQYYGRGICEMLKDIQEVINETVNQRIDNVSLVINRMFGVVEKAVVDPADFVSRPGGFLRLNSKFVQDIRQALMPIDMPDVTRSAYSDVIEMERYAQERTGANRVTIGTAGQVGQDANQTLGGMQMLKDTANTKFAYIGMLMEFGFLHEIFRAYWRLIYSNITPEEVFSVLGPERAQSFVLMTPEEIEKQYQYIPQGVYTMENKALRQARVQSMTQQFGAEPWFDRMAAFDLTAKTADIDPNTLKLSPEEMQQRIVAQGMMQMNTGAPPKPPPMPKGEPA